MGSPELAKGFLLYSTTLQTKDGDPRIFDTTSLKGIYDIRAEDGRVTCKLSVEPRVQNRNGTLHGGCTATIVDVVGTAALLTQVSRGGVSLNINTNYIAAMPGGGVVLIDAKVRKRIINKNVIIFSLFLPPLLSF
jgi:acyl-coenzyme A thioesterase 13